MQTAGIPHQDILSIWGNPYIGVVTRWSELSWQRRQDILKDYPETDRIARSIEEQKRDFYDIFQRNICSPAKRFLDEYGFAISAIASAHPYGIAAIGAYRTGQAVVAVAPKMVKLITTLGSVELARQFQILYKKTSGDGLKKASESNAPRVQATRGNADKYLNSLKNQGVLGKKGVTRDGHEYYQFVKKMRVQRD